MMVWVALLGLFIAMVLAIFAANRWRPVDTTNIEVGNPDQPLPDAGTELRVLTWNIGYGALGKDADVYVDGGKSFRALTKPQIETATKEIAQHLSQTTADVMCLQEVAQASFTTRAVDVGRVIDQALSGLQRYFWADLKTVLIPRVLRISHGMATYSARFSSQCRVVTLPDSNMYLFGMVKKPYVGLMTRVPIRDTDKAWVVINLHLPFFGMTQTARKAQLDRLFHVAVTEYEKGNFVVIGGDWNTRLCPTSFAHNTDPALLTSYANFPQDCLPEDWQIKTDPTTPTVRSINAPFQKGQTYTTIFDGFVISPNVSALSVKTHDLGFAQSDHQPVEATFSAGL